MFQSLIGQEKVKSKLQFYAENHAKTGKSPHILFQGARGNGKNAFAREYAKELCASRGKKYYEINCSSITNNRAFFERIYPLISEGNGSVSLFDEAHKLPSSLQNDLLTILNTEREDSMVYNFEGQEYLFDFTKITILSATTDSQSIAPALRDRMSVVDFEPYSIANIAEIISKYSDITFEENLVEEIASTCRGNPRSAVLMVKENIAPFCSSYGSTYFDFASWEEIKTKLDIRKFGLTNDEISVLRILKERGPSTLQAICSITSQSRGFVQNVLESFLLKNALIRIDGSPVRREITPKGASVL